jgi:hypothetical protein
VVTGWGKYFAKPIVSPGERERDGVLLVGKVTQAPPSLSKPQIGSAEILGQGCSVFQCRTSTNDSTHILLRLLF